MQASSTPNLPATKPITINAAHARYLYHFKGKPGITLRGPGKDILRVLVTKLLVHALLV
jgi:hypothetical protein